MNLYRRHNRFSSSLIRMIGNAIARHDKGAGGLCILNYHRILESSDPLLESEPDVQTFRWQMELLADCFNVLPLYDAVLALANKSMPPRAVCITFDDGYRSTYDLALPVLKELNLPATVFVCSGYTDKANMWNDRIIEAVRKMSGAEVDLREDGLGVYSLKTTEDRKRTADKLIEIAKSFSPSSRLELTQSLETLGGDIDTPHLMLTKEMTLSLSQQGIEIGAHTISHPILCKIDDEAARYEITESKRLLEELTGKPVRLFAYPNGKMRADFTERHVEIVKAAGYAAAFTTEIGAASQVHDFYQLPRCRPWDSSPFLYSLRLLRWLMKKGPVNPQNVLAPSSAIREHV